MLSVDPSLPVPPFEQIKNQITEQRASGELTANHRLPPVRHLAIELGVAPNTVARAYRELEASGLIETRGRHGSFVTGTAESSRKEALAAAADYVARVQALGLPESDAIRFVRDAFGPRLSTS
ncbi:MAG: GntR family transcriptional regulator [Propionibacteriaceae bacterium]|nr:GntR family transcriptional regulator [Propionibacteriaceae bacterium]